MQRQGALLAILTALVLAQGCAAVQTYEGDRPDGQVATIVPENRFHRSRDAGPFDSPTATSEVRVRIAGRSLGGFSDRFTVLPGAHDLAVAFMDDTTPWPDKILRVRETVLRLNAEAGHTYGIRGKATYTADGATVRIWAVRAADRRIVASIQVPRSNIALEWDPAVPDTDDT